MNVGKEWPVSVDEDLKVLEAKMNQLKLDYERYFLGTRPREPAQLRAEVQKVVTFYSNTGIQNTALRFRFGSLCSRYQAFKRRWDETLRQMEDGSYQRHRFRAGLQERPEEPAPRPEDDLYTAYVEARKACGQDVRALSRHQLDTVLKQQRAELRRRYGDQAFEFRVVVEQGKAKLKARRAGA
jgi:hypothetical protein